jgi:hypothetical protein
MTDRVAELALAMADECGALREFVLLLELRTFAGDKEFTTNEISVHAVFPKNARLRTAFVDVCGALSAGSLARLLTKWRGKDAGLGLRVDVIGSHDGWLLWKFAPVNLSRAHTSCAVDALMTTSQPTKDVA